MKLYKEPDCEESYIHFIWDSMWIEFWQDQKWYWKWTVFAIILLSFTIALPVVLFFQILSMQTDKKYK